MGVTLDYMLMLVGHLDDTRGFDAPRERFRRFLREYVSDVKIARTLIEQCQHAPDEQHLRALEDLVVFMGRFTGFEVTFGSPVTANVGFQYQGTWQSPSRVHVVVEVRSALSTSTSAEGLVRSVAALRTNPPALGTQVIGLSVLTPLSASRAKVEQAIAAAKPAFPVGVVPLAGLLSVAELVSTGRVTHADLLRVLESNLPVDFIASLVERSAGSRPIEVSEQPPAAPLPERESSGFWMASVGRDHATTPEEFLELVVGKRHVFGVTEKGAVVGIVRDGDWICFYLPGKGVVGNARVAAVTDSGSGSDIRDARRFRQVLRLEDLDLHLSRPIPPDPETELRLRAAPAAANRQTQILVEISRESFGAMTPSEQPENVGSSGGGPAEAPAGPGELPRSSNLPTIERLSG